MPTLSRPQDLSIHFLESLELIAGVCGQSPHPRWFRFALPGFRRVEGRRDGGVEVRKGRAACRSSPLP